jgi:hypothetical protein
MIIPVRAERNILRMVFYVTPDTILKWHTTFFDKTVPHELISAEAQDIVEQMMNFQQQLAASEEEEVQALVFYDFDEVANGFSSGVRDVLAEIQRICPFWVDFFNQNGMTAHEKMSFRRTGSI